MNPRRRAAAGLAAIVAALVTAAGVRVGFRLWLASVRRSLRIARWVALVVTLRLFRPCPDCHKYIHAHARICHRCGYRMRSARAGSPGRDDLPEPLGGR